MKVLLIEDDPELARQVMIHLHAASHEGIWCETGGDGLRKLGTEQYNVIVLDVGLPDIDGFQIVERLRAVGSRVPVLFLTARDSVTDRVRGLSAGGDDYLTKPFAVEELMARLDALNRRAGLTTVVVPQKLGPWTLDPTRRRLRSEDHIVELQPREWTLLEVLMSNEGRMLTKKYLLEKVWDIHFDPGTNVVDAMICKLRRKLDETGKVSYIQTVRGKGYVFENLSQ
jgi:DNA-binding response OmpR family regulator